MEIDMFRNTVLDFRFKKSDDIPRPAIITMSPQLLPNLDGNTEVVMAAPTTPTLTRMVLSSPSAKRMFEYAEKESPAHVTDIVEKTPTKGVQPKVVRTNNNTQHYLCENMKITLHYQEAQTETLDVSLFTPTKPKDNYPLHTPVRTECITRNDTISYQEVINRTGVKRPQTQQQVMHERAQAAADELVDTYAKSLEIFLGVDKTTFSRIRKEWCHSQAFSLNGPQTKENLNVGSEHFNSRMMPYEYMIKLMVFANHYHHGFSPMQASVQLQTRSEIYTGTHVLKSFTYEFRDLRMREINGRECQMSFCIKWDNPLTLDQKPSRDGFDLILNLFNEILNDKLPSNEIIESPKKKIKNF
jgi:hypothetical protein